MSRRWLYLMLVGLLIGYGLAGETLPPIHVISVADVINPVSAEYITESLKAAIQQGSQAMIIQLDTPGGLDKSMRLIIKEMLNSPIPVIVYVAPSGSRAASAPRLPSSSSAVRPRSAAMTSADRSAVRHSIVARTTLIGLVEPCALLSRSRMPAASTTARTEPPAMTPVPALAGLSMTRDAPK